MSLSRTRSRSQGGAQRRSISADSLGPGERSGQGISGSASAPGNQSVPMGPPAPRQNRNSAVGASRGASNVSFGSNAGASLSGAGAVLPGIGPAGATRREVVKLETLCNERNVSQIDRGSKISTMEKVRDKYRKMAWLAGRFVDWRSYSVGW